MIEVYNGTFGTQSGASGSWHNTVNDVATVGTSGEWIEICSGNHYNTDGHHLLNDGAQWNTPSRLVNGNASFADGTATLFFDAPNYPGNTPLYNRYYVGICLAVRDQGLVSGPAGVGIFINLVFGLNAQGNGQWQVFTSVDAANGSAGYAVGISSGEGSGSGLDYTRPVCFVVNVSGNNYSINLLDTESGIVLWSLGSTALNAGNTTFIPTLDSGAWGLTCSNIVSSSGNGLLGVEFVNADSSPPATTVAKAHRFAPPRPSHRAPNLRPLHRPGGRAR